LGSVRHAEIIERDSGAIYNDKVTRKRSNDGIGEACITEIKAFVRCTVILYNTRWGIMGLGMQDQMVHAQTVVPRP